MRGSDFAIEGDHLVGLARDQPVNHGFANELAGLPVGPVADCVPHVVLEPNWKKAA